MEETLMSTVDEVIKYVMHSPENTNPFILKQILEGIEGKIPEGTVIFKGTLPTMEDLPEPSETNYGWSYIILENNHQVLSNKNVWLDLSLGLDDKVSYNDKDAVIYGGNASIEEI